MADVTIHHQRVDQAVSDMLQATRQMGNALDSLRTGMAAMASTFTGEAAVAWRDFQVVAEAADEKMQELFGRGSVVLTDMHDIQKAADRQGANIYS